MTWQVDDIFAMLDDQLVKTHAMRGSPYIAPFEERIANWSKTLSRIQVTTRGLPSPRKPHFLSLASRGLGSRVYPGDLRRVADLPAHMALPLPDLQSGRHTEADPRRGKKVRIGGCHVAEDDGTGTPPHPIPLMTH